MGRKKKETQDDPVVIPLDLDDEIEEYQSSAETPQEGRLDLTQLKEMSINELSGVARGLGVENPTGMRRQDLIFRILQRQTEREGLIFGEGVLEVLPEGFGFLRAPEYNYLPGPDEPQTMEINTPWGGQLTAQKGDFLVSEIDTPNDFWSVDPVIFEESYIISRPGFCVKKAVTLLVPMIDLTGGDPNREVTVITMEGPVTVRAGDFFLAKGVRGEIWPYPQEKFEEVLVPAE